MIDIASQELSVKKIGKFLDKWGFSLQISRTPYSDQSTYKIVDKDTMQVIFIGNYKHFLKILSSLTIIYEKMLELVVEEEIERRNRGAA
ncbi:hypothetical protein [Flexistipes sp.]|uniref:hypothetical protein n=1 Tax=Flexistipes sp. TaxID=3088135 RepID=UPI002E1BBBDF|nr:hypothetical protein [Flexistipes sp.]